MNKKQKRLLRRILVAFALFVVAIVLEATGLLEVWFGTGALWAEFVLFLIPFLVAGYDVLLKAAKNIGHGQVFDENFLMAVATVGAFLLVFFPDSDPHMSEGAAVMLFYQVGELFQGYAVGKSRASIAAMMDIAPDYANVMREGSLVQVDPNEVSVGDEIVVKPGERVPLDGVVVSGSSELDTAALTGESLPRSVAEGGEVVSGCVNMTGLLTVRVSKPFGESTVSRILELVENASAKKARAENFITRFARYYTPTVVIVAALLAVVPPLLTGQPFATWVERGLTFLVVSCPCALAISVPLSFFGGIGGASRLGILVKGGNYLEALAKVDTVVFDKTGTLTSGTFEVVSVHPAPNVDAGYLLKVAAHAESFSDHPIAASVRKAYDGTVDPSLVGDVRNLAGRGVGVTLEGVPVFVGNGDLMAENSIDYARQIASCSHAGTVLHVAVGGTYLGHVEIADAPKEDAAEAIRDLHAVGVKRTVMLTGDREPVAAAVAKDLGLDAYRAQLLPQRQGRRGGAPARAGGRGTQARLCGRRHQRRPRVDAGRRGRRHGGARLRCRHRGSRRGAHGRPALQHRPCHLDCTQDHGNRAREHRVRPGREARSARAGRCGSGKHVARGLCRCGCGGARDPERHALHAGEGIARIGGCRGRLPDGRETKSGRQVLAAYKGESPGLPPSRGYAGRFSARGVAASAKGISGECNAPYVPRVDTMMAHRGRLAHPPLGVIFKKGYLPAEMPVKTASQPRTHKKRSRGV